MASLQMLEDHIWIKKNGTRKQFSLHMLSKIPAIFEHHQIELVSESIFYFLIPFSSLPFQPTPPPPQPHCH